VGEAVAPDGRCIPIPLVICLFHLVRGGGSVVYAVGFGKKSMFGSLSTSSMVHAEGMFCQGRRGGEIGDVGSDLGFLRIRVGELKASGGVRVKGVGCWTCEGMGWCDSWWLDTPVYYCGGILLALKAMGCKVSGGGCNIGVLPFGFLMLVSPMGRSLG